MKRVEDIPIMAAEAARVLDAYTTAYILHKKPLIGLINGPAIGISVTLLPLFNLVLASDKVFFFLILHQNFLQIFSSCD